MDCDGCVFGSGRVDTSAGGCGWQSRHDREGVTCGAGECERCYDGVYRVVSGMAVAVVLAVIVAVVVVVVELLLCALPGRFGCVKWLLV